MILLSSLEDFDIILSILLYCKDPGEGNLLGADTLYAVCISYRRTKGLGFNGVGSKPDA